MKNCSRGVDLYGLRVLRKTSHGGWEVHHSPRKTYSKERSWVVVSNIFSIFIRFIPTYGQMIQFDEHIFELGWNHHHSHVSCICFFLDVLGCPKKLGSMVCKWLINLFVNGVYWSIIYNWRKFTQRKESGESLPIIHHFRGSTFAFSKTSWCHDVMQYKSNWSCSMYGLFTYIYHKFWPNVGKYTIHWAPCLFVCVYVFCFNVLWIYSVPCDEDHHEGITTILGKHSQIVGELMDPVLTRRYVYDIYVLLKKRLTITKYTSMRGTSMISLIIWWWFGCSTYSALDMSHHGIT